MKFRSEDRSTSLGVWVANVKTQVANGARLAALMAGASGDAVRMLAVLSRRGNLSVEETTCPSNLHQFPSLTPEIPSVIWYEREIHDLFGVRFSGHRTNDALVLPLADGAQPPRPGSGTKLSWATLDETPPRTRLEGEGAFTISYGPVRSGVFESIEYLVETTGEEIPSLNLRVTYKHRGIEKSFEGLGVNDGVLLAERYEGVASVAHAIAFCGAVELIGGIEIPQPAGYVRVIHAELERISNHLDSSIRHVEASGQAVAFARLSFHKERIQRLRSRLCGSRFGRGVVVPGGVSGSPKLRATELLAEVDSLELDIAADLKLLMNTPSFLDRLRGTGFLSARTVLDHGALGPVARGSGVLEDARFVRPYAAYGSLGHSLIEVSGDGDALARQRVRIQEIEIAFALVRRAVEELNDLDGPVNDQWAAHVTRLSGEAIGWAEAPQGEILTWVQLRDGLLTRVKPRSASFHNLALFPLAFPKDILTDFAFIEASFGLSIAGVSG
jgi:Ni,Fe-hydrogenase III large subunit